MNNNGPRLTNPNKLDTSPSKGFSSSFKTNKKPRKALTIFVLVVAAIGIGVAALISSMRLTIDEICEQLEVQMQEQPAYFDDFYDCKGTKIWTNYSGVSIEWHPYQNVQGHVDTRGRIIGDIDVIIDSPAAYQYLEKSGSSFTAEDAKKLDVMKLVIEPGDSIYDGLEIDHYSCMVNIGRVIFLDSEKNEYVAYYRSAEDWSIYKNGEVVAKRRPYTGTPGGCVVCGGTGTVRYYYGSSALEAWLSGHDDYTFGKCPSCDGTGKG